MEFLKPKTSRFFFNDAMFWWCFWKNIDVNVFDDVLKNRIHRANDATNDVNPPPLLPGQLKNVLNTFFSLLNQSALHFSTPQCVYTVHCTQCAQLWANFSPAPRVLQLQCQRGLGRQNNLAAKWSKNLQQKQLLFRKLFETAQILLFSPHSGLLYHLVLYRNCFFLKHDDGGKF